MRINKSKVKALLTQADLRAIGDLMGGLMDKQAAVLASKKDLKDEIGGLEVRLKTYMDEGFESVMVGVDAIAEKLTEKEKFNLLVEWAKEVGEKVGIKVRQ